MQKPRETHKKLLWWFLHASRGIIILVNFRYLHTKMLDMLKTKMSGNLLLMFVGCNLVT